MGQASDQIMQESFTKGERGDLQLIDAEGCEDGFENDQSTRNHRSAAIRQARQVDSVYGFAVQQVLAQTRQASGGDSLGRCRLSGIDHAGQGPNGAG